METTTSTTSPCSSRSSRSSRSSSSTNPSETPDRALMSFGVDFPSWLPESKKQDLIDLQVKTFNAPKGRIRRPRIRKRDPNHVPRPMNSFLSYRTEQQHFIRKYCPGANHREISKIVARWWHELGEKDKGLYREQATSAKLKHAERYPDYKFTPKKKKAKTAEVSPSKVVDNKKVIKEEVLYTNIHELDYASLKELSSCKYSNAVAIDPAITAVAHAAGAYPNQLSFQEYIMNTYPTTSDEKMLKLLEPYYYSDPSIMPVMFPNGTMNQMPVCMDVDPTLFPEQSPQFNNGAIIPSSDPSTQYTPALDYSGSPADAYLTSPSACYPPSAFALSDASSQQYYGYQDDVLWQY